MHEEPATPELQDDLARELNDELFKQFGPILPPAALVRALGYQSPLAYRQAIARNTVPVPIFRIPHRRGHFALARDVAAWLSRQSQSTRQP